MSQAYEPVAPLDNALELGQQQDTSPENLQPPPPPALANGRKDVQDNYEAVGDFGDAQYVPDVGELPIMLQVHSTLLIN